MIQRALVVADNKNREVDILLSHRRTAVVRSLSVGYFQAFIKETLPVAHSDGLLPVHAKHFGYVIAVQLEIGYYPKLIKALQGH